MNLTIKGIDKTINNLNKAQEGISSDKPMKAVEDTLVKAARKNTPTDQNTLVNSIQGKIAVRDQQVTGVVGSSVKHAMAVEKGTRPHWPPIHALEGWARRHGMNAFLVARAISRRGTKGHHMLEKALDDNQRRIIREFQDYYNRLTREAN